MDELLKLLTSVISTIPALDGNNFYRCTNDFYFNNVDLHLGIVEGKNLFGGDATKNKIQRYSAQLTKDQTVIEADITV